MRRKKKGKIPSKKKQASLFDELKINKSLFDLHKYALYGEITSSISI